MIKLSLPRIVSAEIATLRALICRTLADHARWEQIEESAAQFAASAEAIKERRRSGLSLRTSLILDLAFRLGQQLPHLANQIAAEAQMRQDHAEYATARNDVIVGKRLAVRLGSLLGDDDD